MGDASLSQEEIDALLMGADDVDLDDSSSDSMFDETPSGGSASANSSVGYGKLIEALNDAMTTASSSASALVTKNMSINNAMISEMSADQIPDEIIPGSVIVDINVGSSSSAIVVEEDVAKNISMTMMGTEQVPDEMDEAYLSTIGELANTVLSSLSNTLSQKVQDDITPETPTNIVYSGPQDLPAFSSGNAAKITYDLVIDGIGTSTLTHYIDLPSVQRWAENISQAAPMAQQAAPQQQQRQQMNQQANSNMSGGFQMSANGGGFSAGMDNSGGPVNVNPVNFPSLNAGGMQQGQMPSNIDLLLDVQMVLTVELGRTKKYVKDILSLGEGSIIELDKLAGEPVDLLVNGKLIAKGEVVVIDENFGVRVTDIVGPAERLARLTTE